MYSCCCCCCCTIECYYASEKANSLPNSLIFLFSLRKREYFICTIWSRAHCTLFNAFYKKKQLWFMKFIKCDLSWITYLCHFLPVHCHFTILQQQQQKTSRKRQNAVYFVIISVVMCECLPDAQFHVVQPTFHLLFPPFPTNTTVNISCGTCLCLLHSKEKIYDAISMRRS